MAFGVKTEGENSYCKKCNHKLKMVVPDELFNFCPFCGSPLNLASYNLYKEKEKSIKLKILYDVQKLITEKSDLQKLIMLLDKTSRE
jgi:Zn finger protein HypA/HybF involved in hydrogenase expression